VQTTAFADAHGEGAGEQGDGASDDVQNQEWEPHASTSFEHPIAKSAVEGLYALCDGKGG
jgi:hypothetical protein